MRSELRLPAAVYELVSTILLLSTGMKGVIELARQPLDSMLPQMLAVLLLGTLLPFVAFPVFRFVGQIPRSRCCSHCSAPWLCQRGDLCHGGCLVG